METTLDYLFQILSTEMLDASLTRNDTFESLFKKLEKDLPNLKETIHLNDPKHFKKALSENLKITLYLIALAKEKKLFTKDDITYSILKEIKDSKPWIFTNDTMLDEGDKPKPKENNSPESELEKRLEEL